MSYQAPKEELLQRLCRSSDAELSQAFQSCNGCEVYSESLRSLVRDLAEEHQLRERNTLVARLQSWITEGQNGKNSNSRYLRRVKDLKILPFGSSVMGISNRDGDLDISLEGTLLDTSISPTGRLSDALRGFKGDLLAEVHEILKRGQHIRYSKHTQLIRHAKVPVSKFVELHTGIHCDLSIGNTTGIFKSALLAEVLKIDDRVRDLVVIVKKWAKANHLNDPANGSFNSYCLALLVLSFAQSRSPPLIPSFRELFPGLRDIICESQRNGKVDLLAEIDGFQKKAMDWRDHFLKEGIKNSESLCELLSAFFLSLSLFATHSQLLHYTAEGVSKSNSRPTSSCWESGFILSAWDANALKRYQLFVEDPFEAKDNCARTLATQDWWRIVKTLQETVNLLQEFVYALPTSQPEKWHVLWSFLFQYEPLPPLPERPNFGIMDLPLQKPKALMSLHKECLIEHLNKFKASDKKFIAVSYSWWSKEFKQYVMTAIKSLNLYQGKGPKKKIIISKENNIKEDMVEHAVNSTLRARKTHNQVVDPFSCIIKQRLAEFLRCAIRFHKFRASYFDEETKEWLMQCVLEAGLKGKFVDGDLQLERPADLRPMIMMENTPNDLQQNIRKELPFVTTQSNGAGSSMTTDDHFSIVGPLELDDPPPLNQTLLPTPIKESSPEMGEEEEEEIEEELWCEGTENETGISSCGELGTSYETNYIHRSLSASSNTLTNHITECVKVHFEFGDASSPTIKLQFTVIKAMRRSSAKLRLKEELEMKPCFMTETVKVSFSILDDYITLSLDVLCEMVPCTGHFAELGTVDEEGRDAIGVMECIKSESKEIKLHGYPTREGEIECNITHITSLQQQKQPSQPQQQQSATSLMTNGLHNRNAEILRLVFLDLFDAMEKLQDTDSFRGEIEIDPTEYVVPVSWVRQQVRDIARHLVLEIVVPNKRKRPMKIRIRKRARFEESESDEDYDFGRNGSYFRGNGGVGAGNSGIGMGMGGDTRHMNGLGIGMSDHFYCDDRGGPRRDIFDRFPRMPTNRLMDDEDHVTKCLLWIKGMKREKSMHFQYGIYPPDVMQCLTERAEELGLKLEVRDNTMFIGISPQPCAEQQHRFEEAPKLSTMKLATLNEKVQTSIRDHFNTLMSQSRFSGVERFVVPTKGYFMRPEWVAKQVIDIGKSWGFEVLERDGTVEFFAMPPAPPPPPPPSQKPPAANQGLARYFSMPPPSAGAFPITMQSQGNASSHLSSSLARSHSVTHYSSNSNQDVLKKVSCFNAFKIGGNSGGIHIGESRTADEEMKAGNRLSTSHHSNNRKSGSSPDGGTSTLAALWNRANTFPANGSSNSHSNSQKASTASRRQRHDNHGGGGNRQTSRQAPKNGGSLPPQLWRKDNESAKGNNNNNSGGGGGGGGNGGQFHSNRNSRPRGKPKRGRGRGGRNNTSSTTTQNTSEHLAGLLSNAKASNSPNTQS